VAGTTGTPYPEGGVGLWQNRGQPNKRVLLD